MAPLLRGIITFLEGNKELIKIEKLWMTIKWPFFEENRLDLSEETYNRLSHDAEMNHVVPTAYF